MENHQLLLRELASKIPGHLWIDSPETDGASVTWAPLERLTESGMWVGLTSRGFWVIGRPATTARSMEQGTSIAWLTLLEISRNELIQKLDSISRRLGFAGETERLASSLPLGDAISMALDGKSPYWAERAIRMLSEESGGGLLQDRHIEPLEQIASSRILSQRTRHQAMRLARDFASAASDSDSKSDT